MFAKILIANRGEIAARVARTARRMGMATVAVYSDADARSRHVALADEAFRIGPPEAKDSYLRGDRIVEAAMSSGASAIHPGYGFLSENAEFAERCERAGITFVGPPPEAIRAMGDKSAAKIIMEKAGVPLVPGYHGGNQAPDFLLDQAVRIGFPVLIKAAAGGGGKGMRAVEHKAQFDAALAACRRESLSAFGDERVLLEKYLDRPRHIEIQLFADRHGGCVHLFERDCSVQRRHQKVLEEAPAPGMSEDRRQEMGEAALLASRAVGYVGAGTVEFLVDRGGAFFFMEMNTRLQVEHPVTEMITGLDLVEWQLRIAAGERLPIAQKDLHISGHAIEARVYAEDPLRDFVPASGRIVYLRLPAESENVRVDTGVRPGDEITVYYDPMIAKLIVWDRDRPSALERMRKALGEFEVAGPVTNLGFLYRLVQNPDFVGADFDTGLIERHRAELLAPCPPAGEEALALATLAALLQLDEEAHRPGDAFSPWSRADGWRANVDGGHLLVFNENEHRHTVLARRRGEGFEFEFAGRRRQVKSYRREGYRLTVQLDDATVEGSVVRLGGRIEVFLLGAHHILERHDPLRQEPAVEARPGELAAPMPGKIIAVLVELGDRVQRDAPLLILEAMKMEHTIRAPARGRIARILCRVGEQVDEGAELIDFEAEQ
ncbi:MAG TPA: acetyl/propionyl/methylcrotonyl-CoA carboxylase subunit alpha [Burkholderiales bacterium]|nr:acetyl/propionyl/methylcrotonyl-CoA carboxylase subunit alpha [Burkholderiales bacterium]